MTINFASFADKLPFWVKLPDVRATVAQLEGSPVVAVLGLVAVSVFAAKFVRRMFPLTRREACQLSHWYAHALRYGKLPRGLKFRRGQKFRRRQ